MKTTVKLKLLLCSLRFYFVGYGFNVYQQLYSLQDIDAAVILQV